MKKSKLLLSLTTLATAAFMSGLLVAGFLILQLSAELPDAQSIKAIELKVPLRVYSSDNLLISEFGNERRKPVKYDDAPQTLIDAVLASEDDNFFEHSGIDLSGLIRAAISNFRTGQTRQGASTVTMQVARNFYLTPEKTYTRKLKEVLLAIRLEQILTKREILALYLNKIFLGHRAYGFGAAADVYYGKELSELTLAEIAMLAGLPKAPSSYNPLTNPERAKTRRNYVLSRLWQLERISEQDYQKAIAAPISAEKHAVNTQLVAPHIAEMVRAQLTEEFGKEAYWQGLNVYTTIQSDRQLAADTALRAGLQAYDKRHGFRGPVGKVDLGQLKPDPESPSEVYADVLREYPNSHEQVPALVLSTQKESADLQTYDYGKISLTLKNASWAKRHRTANRVGDKPEALDKLLSPGDIVYLQPVDNPVSVDSLDSGANNEEAQNDVAEWALSQIPNVGGALISIEPNSGKIISLTGGYDFFLNKFNRAVQSIRQPGSNIKPFIYSASLDKGFTPATLISGAPIVMRDPYHGTVWRPENYSGKFFGPTRMREALSKSMNLVSIRLLRSIGIPYAREYVARFGLDMDKFSPTLTMALGSGGVTPLEMLAAYAVLANGGYRVKPYFIERITDRNGKTIYSAQQPDFCDVCFAQYLPKPEEESLEDSSGDVIEPAQSQDQSAALSDSRAIQTEEPDPDAPTYQAPRVMSRANNFLTVSMLKDVVRRGTARKALVLERSDLAGKTGTTNDYVDAWFSGFNSKVATTVWVGFDNPTTMGRGEAGSLTALPIWVDYMRTGLKGIEEDTQDIPQYIEEGFVDSFTGRRTDEQAPNAVPELFAIEALQPELALIQAELGIDPLSQNSDEDELETLESDLDDVLEEDLYIEPEDRIIESEEDTKGLF